MLIGSIIYMTWLGKKTTIYIKKKKTEEGRE